MDEKTVSIEYPNQKIVGVSMEREVKQSFLEYSMSVIISRALPDVRDGMKPGQRRILYAMYEDNLTNDKPFRKSATTVGDVLGRYHPHGDAAVYGTMVRMAQDFSLRAPLVEGHGNFGSIDGDPPAAYRYTEARMSKIANEMMRDIEKDVVKWNPNFDNRRKEPDVLPSRFPNILVNGSIGIAVGMATNIPPHNLGEVIDGTIYEMEHPEATTLELMQFIKGPDFPTAATIYGASGIIEAYTTGRGRVMVRAKAEVDEDHRRIVITEIPYQVNKSMLIQAMAEQCRMKKIEGVTDIRDESGRNGMKIVIEYRRDANGEIILNQFYKYTQLQDTCAINMLALVNGEPKVLPLKSILDHYIKFQEDVITRRTKFDLEKALREAHIYEGYKIAIDNIDEVIKIIRGSADTPTAKENLKNRFALSDEQAQAIVNMTLGRLSGLERDKVEAKLSELHATIAELRAILADECRIKGIIKDEMLAVKAKYADPRRTDIVEAHDDIVYEDLIEKHNCVVTLTRSGYIKRLPADTYSAQHRGGKGIIGMTTKEDDDIVKMEVVHSHSTLLLFTNHGRVQAKKAYLIPESSRTAKGTYQANIMELDEGEKVTAIISTADFDPSEYLFMVTRFGTVKRTNMAEFEYHRKGGKIAITLDEGDELLYVLKTDGDKDIILASACGNGARFGEERVSVVGRTARGVRGIRLSGDDEVVGAVMIDRDPRFAEEYSLVTITENGYGKRTPDTDFENKGRGIQGVRCHNVTEKTGKLAGIAVVGNDEDILIISSDGNVIRTPASGIPHYSRTAGGVIIMRMAKDAKVIGFSTTESSDKDGAEPARANSAEFSESRTTPHEGGESYKSDKEIIAEVIDSDAGLTAEAEMDK